MKKLIVLASMLACIPGAAYAQDEASEKNAFSGARVEARLGWETPTVSDGTGAVYKIGQAVSFGGEIGYDLAASSKVTVGPYAKYETSGVDLCDGSGNCLGEKGNWSAGGRIGVSVSPKVQIYGEVGYNSIKMTAKSGTATASDSQGGIGGTLGVAFNLNRNVYAFVDFSYADYGKFAGINLQRRHAALGVGAHF